MKKIEVTRSVFEDVIFTSLGGLYNEIVRDSDAFDIFIDSVNDNDTGEVCLNLSVCIMFDKNVDDSYLKINNDFCIDDITCS